MFTNLPRIIVACDFYPKKSIFLKKKSGLTLLKPFADFIKDQKLSFSRTLIKLLQLRTAIPKIN